MHLCQVVAGRFPLQGQLDVEVLGDGRVHDATGQDVGETTVITRAPVGRGGRYRHNSYRSNYHGIIINIDVIKYSKSHGKSKELNFIPWSQKFCYNDIST